MIFNNNKHTIMNRGSYHVTAAVKRVKCPASRGQPSIFYIYNLKDFPPKRETTTTLGSNCKI